MNGMKIGKKIEIETINFKLVTESLDLAKQHLEEGSADLHFRLSHFRKRVSNKDKNKYDQYFFGVKNLTEEDVPASMEKNEISSDSKKELPGLHLKKEKWLKVIYRKIVASTHPDKFQNFPVESLKQKYLDIYRKTVTAWSKGENDILLLSAYETDIKVKNPNALPILLKGIDQKNARLKEIKNLLAYQWYHVPDKEKSKTLEKYLAELGYEFTKEEVEKVVYLPRKRKVGTRPKSLRKLKNVK